MVDTSELLTALYQKHMATPTLVAAFPGGCHFEQAPASANGTYLVLEVAASPLTDAYGTASSANPIVLLKAVGRNRTTTAAALKVWTDILDDPANDITGAYSFRRSGGAVPIIIGPDEASNATDLWQWAVGYEFNTN